MKNMFAFLIPLLASSFATAANPIPEVTCLNAGGYYGNFAVRQIGNEIEVVAQQGFAHELTSALGAPAGQEARRIDIRVAPHLCAAGIKGALQCQGSVVAVVERYVEPRVMMTNFNANIVVRPLSQGHEVTVMLNVPGTKRQAKATVKFDECRIR